MIGVNNIFKSLYFSHTKFHKYRRFDDYTIDDVRSPSFRRLVPRTSYGIKRSTAQPENTEEHGTMSNQINLIRTT
ncbi:hypothetical protein [Dolichospermum sp. UHCC 0260]|uniref:hypothetical protein n=1 Tax=Dolichospermum sp. UHCC 0260 TaxID=2590025 RepID=UPI0016A8EF9E|nr:hypothetical protein [Dolichospermum sp. UHCC 0260]MTJ34958.1 hypothetical protein [Dolichospermum sp. UHCC 0260]